MEHGIPEGRVYQNYKALPALANISADQIMVTPGATRHIVDIFEKRLFDFNIDEQNYGPNFQANIIANIRKSIPIGIVLTNHPSMDNFNPLDRQLEIYTYVKLNDIDPALNGIAKIIANCRLSLSAGTLSLRTINKTFTVSNG